MDKLKEIKIDILTRVREVMLKKKVAMGGNVVETRKSVEVMIADFLDRTVKANKLAVGKDELARLTSEMTEEYFGYGPIQPLLNDDKVTDIMVNSPKQIFVERAGKLELTNAEFKDDDEVGELIERMMASSGKRLDRSAPYVDFRIPDGSRVTAVIPPISSAANSFVVRKKIRANFSFKDLIDLGTIDRKLGDFLKYCIIARMNILITGTTGTGKTTLLSLFIRELLPSYARVVVMEDTEEIVLDPTHHALKLLTRGASVEGKGEVTLHDLVKLSLHLRPDRLIIGEIRGEEVFSLLQAVNTGHDGSMCTIHANSSQDAIARLEMLCLMAKSNIQVEVARRFIKSGIDVIIHMNRFPGGRRVVAQVSELTLTADNQLVANDIFSVDRKVEGDREVLKVNPTGRVPFFMDRLKVRTDIKDDFFEV